MPDQQSVHHASGLDLKGLAWGMLGIVGAIAFALGAAWWTWSALHPDSEAPPMRIPAPQLEAAPQRDRKAYEAEKARLLTGTAWVDRQAGVARIPIEEAMRLMAERQEKAR